MAQLCRALHVLPRAGGVLDQPMNDIYRLEAAFHAMHLDEERQEKAQSARQNNRRRHEPVQESS